MTALIRSELLQLRTLRSTYGVMAAIAVLVVAITVGDIGDAGAADLGTHSRVLGFVLSGAGIVTALIGALLAATRVAGEYRHATIAQRALAAPERSRLLAAKLLTYAGVGLVAAAVAVGLAIAAAGPALAGKNVTLALTAGDVIDVALRVGVTTALFTMLGVAVGFISRSQQAAVIAIFGTLLGEKLVGAVLGGGGDLLPFALMMRVLDADATDTFAAGAALAALTALLVGITALLLRRRDLN